MAKKERKLTPAEQKRNETFEKVCVEMEEKGYRWKADLTVGNTADFIGKVDIVRHDQYGKPQFLIELSEQGL